MSICEGREFIVRPARNKCPIKNILLKLKTKAEHKTSSPTGGGLIPRSSGATVTIVITGYDPGTKIVQGQFSGSTLDLLNEMAEIKDGEFSAVVK